MIRYFRIKDHTTKSRRIDSYYIGIQFLWFFFLFNFVYNIHITIHNSDSFMLLKSVTTYDVIATHPSHVTFIMYTVVVVVIGILSFFTSF